MSRTIKIAIPEDSYADCVEAVAVQLRWKIDPQSLEDEFTQKEAFFRQRFNANCQLWVNTLYKRWMADNAEVTLET